MSDSTSPEEARAAIRAKHVEDLDKIEDDYKTAIDASNAEHAVNVDKANLARDEATQASLGEMHAALEAVDSPPVPTVVFTGGGGEGISTPKQGIIGKIVEDAKALIGGNGAAVGGEGTVADPNGAGNPDPNTPQV